MKRIQSVLLTAAWAAAICGALAFSVIKIRNWGPALDAPWQGDFIMYRDAARVILTDARSLYRASEWNVVLNDPNVPAMPFPYMPAIGIALTPFAHMPVETAQRIWFWLSVAAYVPVVVLTARRMPPGRARIVGVGLMFLLPAFLDTLYLGQINFVMALLVTAAWYGLDDQRSSVRCVAGMCLGLACGIKPIVAGLALVALLRRRVGFLAGMTAALAVLAAVGLWMLPAEVTRDYVQVLIGYTGKLAPPELAYMIFWNQSIPALWRKVFGPNMTIVATAFSIGTALFVLYSAARCTWRAARKDERTEIIEVSSALLGVLLVAPVTWLHYILSTTPVFAGVARAWQFEQRFAWRLALPVGMILMVLQRASTPLVEMTGVQVISSLTAVGMALWWAATTFSAGNPPRAAQDSGE